MKKPPGLHATKVAIPVQSRPDNYCPNCGSGDIISLLAVYERGTSHWAGGTVGMVGKSFLFGSSEGMSMTASAERAAPPERLDIRIHVVCFVVSCVMGAGGIVAAKSAYFDFMAEPGKTNLMVLICYAIALCGVIGGCLSTISTIKTWRWNSAEYPSQLSRWRRSWMCQRCGNIFQR
jgi:hypothetical protein